MQTTGANSEHRRSKIDRFNKFSDVHNNQSL